MSGYRDPYESSNTNYIRHNYDDTEFNPYSHNAAAAVSRAPTYHTDLQSNIYANRSGSTRGRTGSTGYNSRLSSREHENSLPPVPPEDPLDLPYPGQEREQEEPFEDPGTPRQRTTLKKTPTSASRHSMDMLARTDTRQTLTAAARNAEPAGDIKRWRHDQRGKQWTRGSRTNCIARFCCCTIMIALLLIVSIVLALVMWVRPPQVLFNGIQTAQSGSTFEATTNNEFKINLGFKIFVANPNYFSATFSSIKADISYPLNGVKTDVGGGEEKDITFHSHSNTNFTFPFSFVYDQSKDPQELVIRDLVAKCGLGGGSPQQLTIDYTITIRLRVLVASVGPSFTGSSSFTCPLSGDELKPFLSGLGINIKRDADPLLLDSRDAIIEED